MKISKKISFLIFSLLLVCASFLFVACNGKNYSKTSLSTSTEYIEIFKGENNSKQISVSINNPVGGMSELLIVENSNSYACSINKEITTNYTTTYKLTGLHGGESVITFTTEEGGRSLDIVVKVREFSNTLTKGSNSLYISSSKVLEPSSADFNFNDNTTERNLEYYFYGKTIQSDLLKKDILENETVKSNKFVKVYLKHISALNKDYIIFENENGELFTLGQNTDQIYSFIEVEVNGDIYTFDHTKAQSVSAGEKFTFIAKYQGGSNEETLICEREFYVLIDINSDSFSHDYGYAVKDIEFKAGEENTSYKINSAKNPAITLIPDYSTQIFDQPMLIGKYADYSVIYLEVTTNSINNLLKIDFGCEDTTIATSTKIKELVAGTTKTYYIEINCSTNKAVETNYNIRFYYDGFKNSQDENVNYVYSIPVKVRVIPSNILLNNNISTAKVYTFYDYYASDLVGWQPFIFNVLPEGAEYDSLVIDLTDSDLQVKYKNKDYDSGKVEINDLKETVYLKAIEDASITYQIKELPISLKFNVLQEDSKDIVVQYEIIKGARNLEFIDKEFETDSIYLDINGGKQTFSGLYADAKFSSINFSLVPDSDDVVRFEYDSENPYTPSANNYILNFDIIPIACGDGSYLVTLDNGKQIEIKIAVREVLNSASISSTNKYNSVSLIENIDEDEALVYVLNKNNDTKFDVEVVANGNKNSIAMENITLVNDSPYFELGDASYDNKHFNVYLRENGAGNFTIKVDGYEFKEFKYKEKTITYTVRVVSYSLVDRLYIYKNKDAYGSYKNNDDSYTTLASYVNIYTNTSNESVRQAKFEVDVEKQNGFLFENPIDEQYSPEKFDKKFVYWTTDNAIFKNGSNVSKMYYTAGGQNDYTIEGLGTFDAGTMTFTAFANLTEATSFRLIGHVRQYRKLYSFTINVNIEKYEEVEMVTLQTPIDSIEFSALKQEYKLIAYPTNASATNGEIVVLFNNGTIEVNNQTYSMLDVNSKSSVSYIQSDGKTEIKLVVLSKFVETAANYIDEMKGNLLIVAKDWIDSSGNVANKYLSLVKTIPVYFANGTTNARFTLNDEQDLLAMKNNLSAHYQIKTAIDASSIANELPLGELTGSIIGLNEHATITGLNISSGTSNFGLFTSIAAGAYIEYIQFEGALNIGSSSKRIENANAGIIAGVNNGKLINVGVTLSSSRVYIEAGNIGGLVGKNSGSIIQDFTLFESVDSETRSEKVATLKDIESNDIRDENGKLIYLDKLDNEEGRIHYANLTPKITVYMTGYLNVEYSLSANKTRIGGIAGQNTGTIQKIDSTSLSFTGYSNYMAYSLIKSIPSDKGANVSNNSVGGIAGDNSGIINAGYNTETANNTEKPSLVYGSDNSESYAPGKGIIVGGEIWGYGYVGGVVGEINSISTNTNFAGITARTFVRGQNAGQAAKLAIIANIVNDSSLTNAFAIQAVDDGKTAEESSMAILENSSNNYADNNNVTDLNKLGFGIENHGITILSTANVLTYVSRTQNKKPESGDFVIEDSGKGSYYGDFVVIGTNASGQKTIVDQLFFTKGDTKDLEVEANFNNKMTSGQNVEKDIFFTFYYKVASAYVDDLTSVQAMLDQDYNRISSRDNYYPFKANEEMVFTSRNNEILSIDQTGKITIRNTGLALISASSVLNSNDALSFYIYVVNYFDLDENKLVVYPNLSSTALPYNDSTIYLRGENSASMFVRPSYEKETENEQDMTSDLFGNASYKNVSFKLAANEDLSANVVEATGGSNLNFEIIGQTIIIRKNDGAQQAVYPLTITPQLQLKVNENSSEVTYYCEVNKKVETTKVDYKYGALSIRNKNYNDVPIFTSKTIVETITIESTDENEEVPKYHILGLKDLPLQGTVEDKVYTYNNEDDYLFNVSIEKQGNAKGLGSGKFEHVYVVKIQINTNSPLFKARYEENIYGRYNMYIEAASNSGKNISIQIDFENTNVFSVVVDNYTSLKEVNDNNNLGNSSFYGFPGDSGILAITITPEDSDFDYILIENDEQNYNQGNASVLLSVLARNNPDLTGTSTDLFESGTISGAVTKKGLKINLDDLVELYAQKNPTNPNENKYVPYNGVIYLKYDMASKNVVDGSISKLNVSLYKDGQIVNNGVAVRELTVKLKNFVAVEIEGKEGIANQSNYYMTYNVARGLRYKLNINSYGFNVDNATISSSNPALGTIVEENGEYYLDITSSSINYIGNSNEFVVRISVSQKEGEVVREASSETKIIVNEYVLNYDGSLIKNADIVDGMGAGIINVQVGSQTTLSLNLFDYVEYDENNLEVINKINHFLRELAEKGEWKAYTNLITDIQPNYEMNIKDDGYYQFKEQKGLDYHLGYNNDSIYKGKNYYFDYQGLNILPTRTHLPEEKYYYITYVGYYNVENGVCVYEDYADKESHLKQQVATTFVLNVYTSSSEESPIPIYDYEDLTKMQRNGYYILLNDITIPNDVDENGISLFKPINGNFASFDGNGHTINFGGTYNMGNLSNFGLFGTISDVTTVKNLNINFTSSVSGNDLNTDANDTTYALYGLHTVKFITAADSFIFGAIASENEGIITNCSVSTDTIGNNEYYITVKADNALTGSSYIGGLVGANSGFITNSNVSINVKAPYNIGGLVAQNYRKISGCYFKEGKLINNSRFDQHVAGFAISSGEEAQILSSFVAGAQTNTSLISQDSNSYIESTLASAGFVYENAGKIQDCYTDIDLSKATGEMAGFVFRNGGTIKNSFSLSVLRNNVTASAGFAKENIYDGLIGKFSNCYYFFNKKSNEEGFLGEGSQNINTSLDNVSFEGVSRLNAGGFNDIEKNFAGYSYQSSMGANAVWFFSQGETSTTFVDYIPTTEKVVIEGIDGNTQTNTIYKSELMTFAKGRLELVNPNVKTLSMRNFSYSEYDDATGDITYHYNDDANVPNKGSIHNPRLISNSENMESEILQQTSKTNMNKDNYRMISDVVYEDYSDLYKVIYSGVFEGNGMEISGIGLVSMERHESAGLFAQIGYSARERGSVKNLTITPNEVTFNNTSSVGTLTGLLKYGNTYNITVNEIQGQSKSVSGLNFVGGIVGRAVSSYEMKDVYSYVNVSATHSPNEDVQYIENQGAVSHYSYAGSIVGFAGNGTIYNAHVENVETVMGSRAGFAYGGLGEKANVSYTFVNITSGSRIKAYHYGGYIVGETSGNLSHSYVPSNGGEEATFSVVPKVARAVGGIAGKIGGGKISDALVEQSFVVTAINNKATISNVGGIVGIVDGGSRISTIEQAKVTGDIFATLTLGGGVGTISSALNLDNIAIQSSCLQVAGEKANPEVGGIVGRLENTSLTMKNSYSWSKIIIDTYTSGIESTAHAGGLIASAVATPKLSYCYTSSEIDATVYDSRKIGEVQDFASLNNNDPSTGKISYQNNIKNDAKIDNVYYLGKGNSKVDITWENGSITATAGAITNYSENNFVSFKSKTKNVHIGLAVNNYGLNSSQLATNNGNAAAAVDTTALNNLFGNSYQYFRSEGEGVQGKLDLIYKADGTFYCTTTGEMISYTKNPDDNDEYKNGNKKILYSELINNLLYKDSDGSYYVHELDESGNIQFRNVENNTAYDVYIRKYKNSAGVFFEFGFDATSQKYYFKNLSTSIKYYKQTNGEYTANSDGTGSKLDMAPSAIYEENVALTKEIPTIKVWKTSTDGLSTLMFEDDISWLKQI